MATIANATFCFGETVQFDVALTDGDGAPLDLTGAAIAWRISVDAWTSPLVTLMIGDGVSVVDAEAGEISLILTPDKQAANLNARSYYHDLTVTSNGTVTTQIRGLLTLLPSLGLAGGVIVPPTVPPMMAAAASFTIADNPSVGSIVGTVAVTNAPSPAPAYSMTGETAGLAINAVTGQITVADGALVDFETDATRNITVTATNAAGSASTAVTISISPTGVAPVMAPTASFTITEQPANATLIGIVEATNAPLPAPVYSITGETAGLVVDSSTGEISVSDGSLLNYASDSTRLFVVTATNSAGAAATVVTLTLTEITAGPFPSLPFLFSRIVVDDPSSVIEQTDTNFAPSAVDLANNKIVFPSDPIYGSFASYTSITATRVYFSSTGTLPAPLLADTPYYLKPASGGGYEIYPETGPSDYAAIQNMLAEEKPMPAQNWAAGANRIVLTTQGSGTHRVYSNPLLKYMSDKLNPDYFFDWGGTDKHRRYELFTGAAKRAIQIRILARDPSHNGSYNLYGPTLSASSTTGSAGRVNFQNGALRGKRSTILYAVLSWDETDTYGVSKAPVSATGVNTTTGVITTSYSSGHGLTTGWRVRLRAYPGGTLPTGLSAATDYYVRNVSSTTMSLHPSSADATGNTNVIIPSSQAVGGFTVVALESGGDGERMRFVSEIRDAPGANTHTVRTNGAGFGETNFNLATDVYTGTATVNCRLGFTGRTALGIIGLSNAHYARVRIRIAASATRPTCVDTGTALADGNYWMTREPGSSTYCRLHRTEADAIAALGVANSSLVNVIRWSAVGQGFMRLEAADKRSFSVGTEAAGTEVTLNDGAVPTSPPLNTPGVLITIVDHNNPAKSFKNVRVFWNGSKIIDQDLTNSTKGDTSTATISSDSCWTLLNSPQGHVTFEGKLWEMGLGGTVDAIADADIVSLNTWLRTTYGV